MRTDEEEKSEARAFLRRFAAELTDWAAVDNCNAGVAAVASSSALVDAIWTLREEFKAWAEFSSDRDDDRRTGRNLLADVARLLDIDVEDEDCLLSLHLRDDRETRDHICLLVMAVFYLRDDLIRWGKDDLLEEDRLAAEAGGDR